MTSLLSTFAIHHRHITKLRISWIRWIQFTNSGCSSFLFISIRSNSSSFPKPYAPKNTLTQLPAGFHQDCSDKMLAMGSSIEWLQRDASDEMPSTRWLQNASNRTAGSLASLNRRMHRCPCWLLRSIGNEECRRCYGRRLLRPTTPFRASSLPFNAFNAFNARILERSVNRFPSACVKQLVNLL